MPTTMRASMLMKFKAMSKPPFIYMRVCGQTYTLNNYLKPHVIDEVVMGILKYYPPDAEVDWSDTKFSDQDN